MHRRDFLNYGLAIGASSAHFDAWSADKWGSYLGYPTGWAGQFSKLPEYRVGNYSGGFETMFPHHTLAPSDTPLQLAEALIKDFQFSWRLSKKTIGQYLDSWPATGLIICRDSNILFEEYRHQRTAAMRLTSWSMAKSVTSLLLGICLDKKLIRSYDDTPEMYLPELQGTLHGAISLRNLSNMSSGAQILHERDNAIIYPTAYISNTANISKTVAAWNQRKEEQGRTFNYNELCPLTLGMVIRKVTGASLSSFAQNALWIPMGAQSAATWTTDSEKNEFNCIGFAATLRDWARLGTLIANKGKAKGNQVVSEQWIHEFTRWGELDKQVKFDVVSPGVGYKAHMWHIKPDGTRLSFNGHHGQRVMVDMPTRTVLVHTAVEHDGNWKNELYELFDAATKI
jgi:CubicO group peptidase (beta-lactamase class C family)